MAVRIVVLRVPGVLGAVARAAARLFGRRA